MPRFAALVLVPLACLITTQAAPAAPARSAWETAALDTLAARANRELTEGILPFWMARVRNPAGGFFGEIRADGTVNERAPRGALMTCRIHWTFSAAFRRDPRPEYRAMADWAWDDLNQRFWDAKHGGLFWTVRADGTPLARHKQVYLQSFGIYALSEYHRATGDRAALERAQAVFRLLEDRARDARHGGYLEAFSPDWSKELPDMRRVIGGTAPKSQNTHLHVMEAYATLLRAWPDPGLREAQRRLLGLMLDRVLDAKSHHLGLFFEMDWTPSSTGISYGHDIEAAWLLCDAADALGDAGLIARTRDAAVKIARATLAEGVSPLGAIYNEGGPRGITNPNHEWWPQAEAVVGFLNAYQISGDADFLRAAERTWEFIEAHVIDRGHGEWFAMVDTQGKPMGRRPKAYLWKCPYHNGRACMETVDRIAAIKNG